MHRPEPTIGQPRATSPAPHPAARAEPAKGAGVGPFVVTFLFWLWQAGCLTIAVFMVIEARGAAVNPLGAAWLLRDGIATWAMGSVGLAACRFMTGR